RGDSRVNVEGSLLVRVLAVTQDLVLLQLQIENTWPLLALCGLILRGFGLSQAAQISCDGTVVGCGVGKNLGSQFQAQAVGGRTVGAVDFGEDATVIGGVDDHRRTTDRCALGFCSGAQHGGTADVDVLNGIGKGAAGLGDGFAEGVEVHHQKVNAINAVLFQCLHVFSTVPPCQQTAMNLGVKRLHTPIEDLGGA